MTEIPTGAQDFSVEEYKRIESDELIWRACQAKQEEIQKAFDRYRKASTAPVAKLDLGALRQMGFLTSPPSCPTGGDFSLDRDGRVVCSLHGNDAQPSSGHQRFETLFKRFTIARNFYNSSRFGEALFHLEKIVQDHPNHVQAQELAALCKKDLKRWGEAAQSLHQVCNLIKDDARLYFDAAVCFYAADNRTLADEYLKKCQEASWDGSQRSITRRKDFYLLKDRAAFTEKFVAEKRYLDFQMVRAPAFPTDQCEERLNALRASLKRLVDEYFAKDEVKAVVDRVAQLEGELAGLRDFEVEGRQKAEAAMAEARRKLQVRTEGRPDDPAWPGKGTLPAFLRDRLADQALPVEFCPDGERYFIDGYGNLQCAKHRELLADATLDERMKLSDRLRRVLNEALVKRFSADSPERKACFERQAKVLDAARLSRVDLGPDALDRLLRERGIQTGEDGCPSDKKRYEVKTRPGGGAYLACPVHGSYELLLELPEEGDRVR